MCWIWNVALIQILNIGLQDGVTWMVILDISNVWETVTATCLNSIFSNKLLIESWCSYSISSLMCFQMPVRTFYVSFLSMITAIQLPKISFTCLLCFLFKLNDFLYSNWYNFFAQSKKSQKVGKVCPFFWGGPNSPRKKMFSHSNFGLKWDNLWLEIAINLLF